LTGLGDARYSGDRARASAAAASARSCAVFRVVGCFRPDDDLFVVVVVVVVVARLGTDGFFARAAGASIGSADHIRAFVLATLLPHAGRDDSGALRGGVFAFCVL
jgi:hypothetical protein